MSNEGVFAVHRGVFKHPFFADEPYTEREAWLWLLGNAVWRETRVRSGRVLVQLQRGQLAYANRFMAKAWKWPEARVRRFLKRAKTDAMIEVQATRQTTLITICNYDEYQFQRRIDDAQIDAPSDAQATHKRRKEEEGNKLIREEERECSLRSQASDWPKDYREEFWDAYPRKEGKKPALAVLDRIRKSGEVEFDRLMAGVAKIPTAEPKFIPHAKTWLGQARWDDEPLTGGNHGTTSNVIDATDRLIERIRNLGGPPGICGPESTPVVRMLPQGGCERPGDVHDGDSGHSGGVPAGRDLARD